MLIELISQSNYQSFNIKLAQMLGLEESIYLNALIEINEKAIRKNKLVNKDFFKIDRSYITQRTTLTTKQQTLIETKLESLEIIRREQNNLICVQLDTLTSILMANDEVLEKDISNLKKVSTKKTKDESILASVKKHIDLKLPQELQTAYSEWLDVIQQRFGFVSKQLIISAQNTVNEFSDRNLDVALDVIHVAAQNGYKDMQWAINKYNKDKANNNLKGNVKLNTNVEVRTDISF